MAQRGENFVTERHLFETQWEKKTSQFERELLHVPPALPVRIPRRSSMYKFFDSFARTNVFLSTKYPRSNLLENCLHIELIDISSGKHFYWKNISHSESLKKNCSRKYMVNDFNSLSYSWIKSKKICVGTRIRLFCWFLFWFNMKKKNYNKNIIKAKPESRKITVESAIGRSLTNIEVENVCVVNWNCLEDNENPTKKCEHILFLFLRSGRPHLFYFRSTSTHKKNRKNIYYYGQSSY